MGVHASTFVYVSNFSFIILLKSFKKLFIDYPLKVFWQNCYFQLKWIYITEFKNKDSEGFFQRQ